MSTRSFVSQRERMRGVYNSYLDSNADVSKAIRQLETFIKTHYVCALRDLDEYHHGIRSRARFLVVIMTRVMSTMNTLRGVVAMMTKNEFILLAMFDATYLLGDAFLLKAALVIYSSTCVMIGGVTAYQEATKTLYMGDIFYLVKHNLLKYPPSPRNERKAAIKVNVVTSYIMKPTFYTLLLFSMFVHSFFTAQMFVNFQDYFWPAIAWFYHSILFFVFMHQSFAYFWVGFVLWLTATLILKYEFNEINTRIELSLKRRDINLLMYAINEHNYWEIITKKFNHFFRVIIFLVYYVFTLGFQILLYLTHKKDTVLLARIIFTFLFLVLFWAALGFNVMSTWVGRAAHKPYRKVFSFACKTIRISSRHRLKLMAFIEKLSGREIGFYCYDLFPMNSYEFYQYLYIAGSNYFLLISLFE